MSKNLFCLSGALLLVACGSGGSGSGGSSQTPAQQFAGIITNEIATLNNSGSLTNPVLVGNIGFPAAVNSDPAAYLISYTGNLDQVGQWWYSKPILNSLVNGKWQSTALQFTDESAVVSYLSVAADHVYMYIESNLYVLNGSTLQVVESNPFVTAYTQRCSVSSMNSNGNLLYLSGTNDNGGQIYSYDGSKWTNMNPPTAKNYLSVAADDTGNLYAMPYIGGMPLSDRLYKYTQKSWSDFLTQSLPVNLQALNYASNSLYGAAPDYDSDGTFNLYQLNASNSWTLVVKNFVPYTYAGIVGISQIVNDPYGSIYYSGEVRTSKVGSVLLANLIVTN